ncbi:MAG: dephospho-CoA kinase [Planctomycetota bacterium]
MSLERNSSISGKPIIGLAGGIGSGKSTIASLLSEFGASVISSDKLNHEQLNRPEVVDCIREWWGEGVLTEDGRADRDAIRAIVTRDAQARRRLEDLVHPLIRRRQEILTSAYLADPDVRAIVIDSPLLYEVGLAQLCNFVIFVESAPEVRQLRVLHERGWAAEDIKCFEETQLPLETKKENADYVILNNSDINDLRRQVEVIYFRILSGQ